MAQRTIAHMYDRYEDAEMVVSDLEAAGIPHSDISLVANAERRGQPGATSTAPATEAPASTGAGTGATVGTAIGGGLGLLAGIGSLAIPGVGPVVAAGWLVATLAGAGIGAAGGGLVGSLTGAGVRLYGGSDLVGKYPDAVAPATEENYRTEYLDLALSLKTVADLEEAIAHIQHYGSRHSEVIVTENPEAAAAFLNAVDSAVVLWNASTRFNDGFEFGFGAEIGISTDRLHARGPMGLNELCSYKYLVTGTGQVRA